MTAISENPRYVYVFAQHTHTHAHSHALEMWRHDRCWCNGAPDSAASTAARRHFVQSARCSCRTKPSILWRHRKLYTGTHDAPEVAQDFFFRGHLRRLAAPKARQERSSSTRVTRCSPPYDRSVDRDDSRKKIATLSFKRERLSQR